MRKIYLLIIFLFIGKLSFADSTFLPGLEFHHLYKDTFIFETSDNGIPEDKYIGFLLSDEVPLGEKIALISALASYFEWIDVEDNPDNDEEDYFETYTATFKENVRKKYTDTIPAAIQLLETLMDDYQTLDPNINRYNQLASEMPQSLAAQSVRVIAFAYEVLYGRRWDMLKKYEDKYLTPYRESWKSYERDINPEVSEKVEEWPPFIYMWHSEESDTIQQDDLLFSVQELETTKFYDEDGSYVTIGKTIDGENFVKEVSSLDTLNRTSEDIKYYWDPESQLWINDTKLEGKHDLHDHLVLLITYHWDIKRNEWVPYRKDETIYTYEGDTVVETKVDMYFFEYDEWEEAFRQECKSPIGTDTSCLTYKRNSDGEFVLVDYEQED